MSNWKLLTGVFIGEVVKEGQILDVPFAELDDDLQERIIQAAKDNEWNLEDLEDCKEHYENSWDTEETDEKITMTPVSEW